ncbi:TonB-dependent receptor [Pseudomaricurvus alkylphenolicus]|uniref:TonB-dependent receptor plug domain-containing protein n=1 Tax=Pseudomaricurvus alkylphenolicus TaxID=1306991 RepID=UPI0014220557|nr:TonB-dependent receptor [Pseudomaricurvus alkylphenolicus]NIB38647.1 TonB-dependent receptor [Pseudomaricurvus alkylphenolicus]
MHTLPFRNRLLPLAIAATCTTMGQFSVADEKLQELEEIIVTGSYIKGAVTDAPSPVSIINRDDLMQQGAPSTVDIVQSMTFSSGTENQTNQFASGNTAGTANINLRGLGLSRTLVLMNGRRMVTAAAQANDGSAFVDINTIPALAIERIEVLKDGAAAILGSDAVAGVANFTTRGDFEGFEVSGSYQDIDGSDGDYDFGAIWGVAGDNWNLVTSLGYRERTELPNSERLDDVRPRVDTLPSQLTATIGAPNGLTLFGQSSTGNPAAFIPVPLALMEAGGGVSAQNADLLRAAGLPGGLRAGFVRDPECEAAGGVLQTSNRCGYDFINFSNSIEDEEHIQFFAEGSYEFDENTRLFAEVLYANSEVPNWKTSPSYPPLLEADPNRYLPADHPALLDFVANYPGITTGGIPANGAFAQPADFSGGAIFVGRPVAVTGPAEVGSREHTTYRFLAGLEGELSNGASYTTSLTHAENVFEGATVDNLTERYSAALRGFGGPNCDGVTAGANGCQYYNPFSSAIPGTEFYDPALANDPELLNWMKTALELETTSTLTVFEAVVSNELFDMEAGAVTYAVGFQYRDEEIANEYNDIANIDLNPGGVDVIGNPTGAFTFLRGGNNTTVDQDVYAVFGELAIPVASNVDLQLALRYEDYSGNIGETLDPKVAIRWDLSDQVTLRGSASTTFRAPSLNQTTGHSTALEFIGKELLFKAVDRIGNPDLDAETADTFNLGVIYRPTDRSSISLDYWHFDFSDPIVRESPNALVNDVANQNGGAICGVSDKITCDAGGVTIARIVTEYVNGPDITTNGIDLSAQYGFDALGGQWDLGLDATYVREYQVGEFQGKDEFDAVGSLNAATFVRPMQEWKANFSVNYRRDQHNVRLVAAYIDDYIDNATDVLNGTSFADTIYDRKVDSHVTYDLYYTLSLNEGGSSLSASVINIADEDAPYVRADLRYDAQTHNAFGRMIKLGFTHKFQ